MSRSPKSMILVVLMWVHVLSDLHINYNISDSNSTTPDLEDYDNEESGSSNEPYQESFNNPIGPSDRVIEVVKKKGNRSSILETYERPPLHISYLEGFSYHPEFFPVEQISFYGPSQYAAPQDNSSKKQRRLRPRPLNAQLFSRKDSTLSNIHVNPSEYNDSSLNVTSDMRVHLSQNNWRVISKEAELFLTGRLSTVFIPSFYTLVCIISVPLNICAVLVFVLRVKPKNPASIYMLNLACADLLFAALLPFKISYHFNGNSWIFGPAMCRLVTAAFFWNMYCSVLLIACMSVDRLLAVVYPVDSLTWRSPRKAVIACAAMWVLSFVGSMHVLFTEQTLHLKLLNITTCHDIQPSRLFKFYKLYYITLCCLLFFLPLIIIAVSYTRVIMTLSKAQPGIPDHDRKKRRAVVLASTVLLMFVICFTPTNCVYIVHQHNFNEDLAKHADNLYIIYLVFLCLGSLNCLLDPLVYYFGSSHFQKELSRMLGCQKTAKSLSYSSASTSQTALKSNHKESFKINTNSESPEANLPVRVNI